MFADRDLYTRFSNKFTEISGWRSETAVAGLLVIWILIALWWGVPLIQSDLKKRTVEALERDGLGDLSEKVSFSGHDARLISTAEKTQEVEKAKKIITDVRGVRSVYVEYIGNKPAEKSGSKLSQLHKLLSALSPPNKTSQSASTPTGALALSDNGSNHSAQPAESSSGDSLNSIEHIMSIILASAVEPLDSGEHTMANELIQTFNSWLQEGELFDSKVTPSEYLLNKLDKVTKTMQQHEELNLGISGKVDINEVLPYSLILGFIRASKVHDYLVAQGVPEERVMIGTPTLSKTEQSGNVVSFYRVAGTE